MGIKKAKRPASEAPAANPAVKQCLKLLAQRTSHARGPGGARLGGRAEEYPSVPDWGDDYRKGDTYLRMVILRGRLEIIDDDKLPHRGYRDPTPKEAAELKKRLGSNVCQMEVDYCDDTQKRCRWKLMYRVRKPDYLTTNDIPDYHAAALISDYKRLQSTAPRFVRGFFPPVAQFKELLNYRRRIDTYRQMRASLPPKIRACYPTVAAFKKRIDLEDELRHEYSHAQAAARNWPRVEASTRPVIANIEKLAPAITKLSIEGRRYLTSKIDTAQSMGMSDEHIIAIAAGVAERNARNPALQKFFHEFMMIIDLNIAKQLHNKNIEGGGSGISPDFERFVDETIEHIKSKRIGFSKLSKGAMKTGIEGMYNHIYNYFELIPPERLYRFSAAHGIKVNIHEATHSFDDAHNSVVHAHTEMHAYNNGHKTELLCKQYCPGDSVTKRVRARWKKLARQLHRSNRNARVRQLTCLGFGRRFIGFMERGGGGLLLFRKGIQGYRHELKGGSAPAAHRAMAHRSMMVRIINAVRDTTIDLFPHAEKRQTAEAMLRGACSTFHRQRSRLADKRYIQGKKADAAWDILHSWAAIHSTILHLEPGALPRLSRIMETRHLTFIEGLFWKLHERNEGID